MLSSLRKGLFQSSSLEPVQIYFKRTLKIFVSILLSSVLPLYTRRLETAQKSFAQVLFFVTSFEKDVNNVYSNWERDQTKYQVCTLHKMPAMSDEPIKLFRNVLETVSVTNCFVTSRARLLVNAYEVVTNLAPLTALEVDFNESTRFHTASTLSGDATVI